MEHAIALLLKGSSVEEVLNSLFITLVGDVVVNSHYDWANHPERVGVRLLHFVRQQERWCVEVESSYQGDLRTHVCDLEEDVFYDTSISVSELVERLKPLYE